jgi:hypothetical protein
MRLQYCKMALMQHIVGNSEYLEGLIVILKVHCGRCADCNVCKYLPSQLHSEPSSAALRIDIRRRLTAFLIHPSSSGQDGTMYSLIDMLFLGSNVIQSHSDQ